MREKSEFSYPYRGWEYISLGDYHRNLDPNWSYTPTYLQKVSLVSQFIKSLPKDAKILDAGCGEGILVEKFRQQGWDIQGIDLNYESEFVQRGDVRNLPYSDANFDVVLFLDALEHLAFADQTKTLLEIYRVLKTNGYLFLAVPNLAHLNSRFCFFLKGKLDRTDRETNHIGERPFRENEQLLKQANFQILKRTGVTFTLPFVYHYLICKQAAKFRWLHDLFEPLARTFPALAMLTFFICQKPSDALKSIEIK